jgi:prolyl-tRNA synthetase
MNMTYIDENGANQTPTMGCYGIGVGRTAAAAIEQNHDDNGIILPIEIAPFSVSILLLDADDKQTVEVAEKLYFDLENANAGIDVLLDDRQERPGVKFKDHDLIGMPIQVIVGARGIKNGTVEVKIRQTGAKEFVAIGEIFDYVVGKIKK